MTSHPAHLTTVKEARSVKEGDTIVHLDGQPAVVVRAGMHQDAFGWAYDFSFEGDRVPYACRGSEPVTVLRPIPKVGDHATLCYPSDRYPFEVTYVSSGGKRLRIRRLNDDLTSRPNADERTAAWSAKYGCFKSGGTPVSIGTARLYLAPEV